MFKKNKTEDAALQNVINALLEELNSVTADTEEYSKMVDQLTKLYTLKAQTAEKGVSKETMAIIAGNLAGILVIVSYEHLHPIASKALSFVGKLR